MAEPTAEVERLVREVLAELAGGLPAGATAGLPAGATAGSSSRAQQQPATESTPGDLVLDCRVVTMLEVDGKLAGAGRLVIPPQAIVTPAVRDELHRRNIGLAYAEPAHAPTAVRLVLATLAARFDPAALIRALGGDEIRVERRDFDCLIAATDYLAAAVAGGGALGLLLSRHTTAALCLANRHRGVRAVLAADAAAVAAAAAAVGANLLVLDPAAAGVFPLKQAIREFCRGGVRPCPEVYKQRLS